MRILFSANELHFPDNMGGSRMDVHDLALTFREQGHDAAVLGILRGRNRLLGYRMLEAVTGKCLLRRADRRNGYETVRCGSWQVPRLLRADLTRRPADLVITQGPGGGRLAGIAAGQAVPAVMRLTSAAEVELLAAAARDDPATRAAVHSPLVALVTVSRFLATLTDRVLGVAPAVIYPPVRLEDCLAVDREPDHITFVNPIPMKGRDVALQVAALLPHRRFVFVEAWNMRAEEREALERGMSGLANVSLQPRSVGLAHVYRSTALLLVPSQCPEAFSRVVLEACANGIPVLASRTGGVPEAMGESGVLLDAGDPAGRWAAAIEGILTDQVRQRHLEAMARVNAQRAELGLPFVAARYLSLADGPPAAAAPWRMGTGARPG
jgi:glycosyltransferase involved in cell wall biosynthesis